MPEISEPCPNCSVLILVSVNQIYTIWDELRWHREWNCPACGYQAVECGSDNTPEAIRHAVLAAYGTWELTVDETAHRATQAVSLLRAALNLSLADAMSLRRCVPGPVTTGTRGEIDRLRALLSRQGLSAHSREQTSSSLSGTDQQ